MNARTGTLQGALAAAAAGPQAAGIVYAALGVPPGVSPEAARRTRSRPAAAWRTRRVREEQREPCRGGQTTQMQNPKIIPIPLPAIQPSTAILNHLQPASAILSHPQHMPDRESTRRDEIREQGDAATSYTGATQRDTTPRNHI